MAIQFKKKKKTPKVGKTYETTDSKNGSTKHEEGEIDTGTVLEEEHIAMIHVEMGNTINTGNYESSKFTVGITMPSGVDAVDETYEFCQNWANDRLTKMNEELQELMDA